MHWRPLWCRATFTGDMGHVLLDREEAFTAHVLRRWPWQDISHIAIEPPHLTQLHTFCFKAGSTYLQLCRFVVVGSLWRLMGASEYGTGTIVLAPVSSGVDDLIVLVGRTQWTPCLRTHACVSTWESSMRRQAQNAHEYCVCILISMEHLHEAMKGSRLPPCFRDSFTFRAILLLSVLGHQIQQCALRAFCTESSAAAAPMVYFCLLWYRTPHQGPTLTLSFYGLG